MYVSLVWRFGSNTHQPHPRGEIICSFRGLRLSSIASVIRHARARTHIDRQGVTDALTWNVLVPTRQIKTTF